MKTPARQPIRTSGRATVHTTVRTPIRKTALAIAATLALGAAPTQQALAASCTWNPATGNWNVAANWSCGIVPSGGPDDASIAGGKVVTINTAQSVRNLTNSGGVNIDAFLLTLSGAGSTVNTGTINIGAGAIPNNAALQVSSGHNINNTGGVINISADSVLNQFGSTITGGTINSMGTGRLMVFSNGANGLSGVTLGGVVDMASNANSRQIIGGGMTLSGGQVDIANGGILSITNGNQTLGGSGSFNLNDAGARFALEGNSNTTLGANVVLRGQGNIGQANISGGTHNLINDGRISADVNATTLTIVAGASAGSVINHNLIDARNGGTLNFSSVAVDNTGGLINAQNGSVVLHSGGTITGGTLGRAGSGVFRASSNGGNGLASVTLTGVIDMTTVTNSREIIAGGMTFSGGSVNIGNGGILSIFTGNQLLTGNGSFNLNDAGARFALEGNSTTTLDINVVVRGQGNIGQAAISGGTHHLVNNGLISADVAGGTLNIVPGASAGNVTNNGILEATGGGTLLLSANVFGNAGSQIRAGAASTVVQNGVTITGVINTTGAGVFAANNSGSNVLSGVTLSGVLDMTSIANSREIIAGGLTFGTGSNVNIGNGGILSITTGNQTLGGSGTINLNDAGARFALEGNSTTTLDAGVVLRGQGNIGQAAISGGTHNLVNNGLISADVAGGTLNIVPGASAGNVTNNGILEATGGGTLLLSANIIGNPGGQIRASAGSAVVQNGVTVSGVINTTGAGVFSANGSGSNVLQGVTLNGVLDMTGIANSREIIAGGFTFGTGGNVNIGNTGILSITTGNQTLGGSGTINLNDAGARFALEGNSTTTLDAGVVLRGQGNIGQAAISGGTHHLVNDGRISADVNATTLTIVAGASAGSVINHNLIDARNGGTLNLSSVAVDNTGGLINAQNGSVVLHNGGTITGGTLGSAGSGVFRASTNGGNGLASVTLTGVIDMTTVTNSREIIAGGMTFSGGSVNIASGGILSITNGNQTLGGTGTINLNDAGARFALEGNSTTTLGANVVLRGQGNIGQPLISGGTHNLINQGSIIGDGGVLSIVRGAGSGNFTNDGLLRATTTGTVNLAMPITGTGTLQVDPTGTLNLANGGNTQGKLVMGAAGSLLNLGTGNLTITNDYTNTAAGTGNSFNRRAGINGAGLVVAGADAAQAITGTGVSNGATANATLTLGNVRVGATTFNYQVANTGSTGPSLRGAIQTSVNGANLTDARLSGAGVTASNYNTGAPGNNTGNLGVTFTVANAGALAPLTGQVLNLRSNFENIADQKLNIVLAAGAAAFNTAQGSAASPVQVANQRTGGSNTATLQVTNTAAAGAFSEDLNVSVGGSTGGVSSTGSIAGRLAGANSGGGNIAVAVNTTTAGLKTGSVTLDYQTAGTVNGVSNGLGVAALTPSQVVTVNGNVYLAAQASPAVLSTPINLGNFRAGSGAQAAPGIVIANTNVAPAGFQEGLAAAVLSASGQATGTGFANAVAGGSGTLNVGLSGINAGLNTGTVGVQLRSNGIATTGDTGLGNLDIGGPQTITINANGYRLAQANTIAPINFGNVLANSVQTRTVNVSNIATADGFSEALNAAFGIVGGVNAASFSGAGGITGLLAGASNNTSMVVTLNTSAAGTKTANVQILLDSNGTAIGNGLGLTALPTQTINLDGVITANVGNLASAGLSPTNVNFGKFREGAANQTQQLTVTNQTVGMGEGLNASFGAASGGASNNGGSIASLATGGVNSTAMSVSLGGLATAGNKTGSQVLNFVSDGSFNNNTPTNLPSQTVNLSADVYRLATASVNTPINLAARRVGDAAATGTLTIANSAAADGFSEGLRGAIGAAPGGFTVAGAASTALIAAGGSEARTVSLSTAVAGNHGGNVTIGMVSNGAGTSGFGDAALADKIVALTGKVYTQAMGQLGTPVIDFGIVRVGQAVAGLNIAVNNTAAVTALNDTLRANLSGISGPFSSGNTVGGVAAQGSGQIGVALNTSAAGVYMQNGSVSFLSQNPDMVDVSAGANGSVLVKAQVNNLANADFDLLMGLGLLTQNGTDYILDLGNVALSGTEYTLAVRLDNDVAGPADDLSGLFDLAAVDEFNLTGFGAAVGPLGAGQATGNLGVGFLAAALGMHEDIVNFNGFSSNASDPAGIAQMRRLIIRANVVDANGTPIPEPGTLGLLLIAAVGAAVARRQRQRAH